MGNRSREEWTLHTLKKYFEAKFDAAKSEVGTALAASEKAVLKAEAAANERFKGLNELRGAMDDASKKFATNERLDGLEKRFELIDRAREASSNKSLGSGQLLVLLISLGALAISTFMLLKH